MISINDITIGMSAQYSHLITSDDIERFADASGDYNPIHLDNDFAKNTKFGRRIAHGALISSFFSKLFASKLPGVGSIYVSQNSKFLKPVFIGDIVEVEVKVQDINREKKRVYFLTTCRVDKTEVLIGSAEIYIP